jgi:hypothetical protein
MKNNTLDEDFFKQEEIISPIKWWESRRKNFNKRILPYPFIFGCILDIFLIKSKFKPEHYFEWIGTAIGTYLGILIMANILFSIPELIEIVYKLINQKTFKKKLRVIFEKIFILIIIIIVLAFFILD